MLGFKCNVVVLFLCRVRCTVIGEKTHCHVAGDDAIVNSKGHRQLGLSYWHLRRYKNTYKRSWWKTITENKSFGDTRTELSASSSTTRWPSSRRSLLRRPWKRGARDRARFLSGFVLFMLRVRFAIVVGRTHAYVPGGTLSSNKVSVILGLSFLAYFLGF